MLRKFRYGLGVCVAVAVAFSVLPAQAQGKPATAPSSTPNPAQPPDVVILNNGGMYRGSIVELVPNEHVEILLHTGKTRRFPMKDVKYAGLAANMPGAEESPAEKSANDAEIVLEEDPAPTPTTPQPAPLPPPGYPTPPPPPPGAQPYMTVHAREARLKLRSSEPGITFHRRNSSAYAGDVSAIGYAEMCTAPCEVSLPEGTHTFAISRKGGRAMEAEPVTVGAGVSRVDARFQSRSGLRTAGVVLLIAGTVAGGYLMLTATSTEEECTSYSYGTSNCYDRASFDTGRFLAGTALLGGGVAIGVVMLTRKDLAKVTVQPVGPLGSLGPRPVAALDGKSHAWLGPAAGLRVTAEF